MCELVVDGVKLSMQLNQSEAKYWAVCALELGAKYVAVISVEGEV